MGKKTIIFSLLTIQFFISMDLYGQNYNTESIEWVCKDSIEYTVCADTCQIKALYANERYIPIPIIFTKEIINNDKDIYVLIMDIGFGLPINWIHIYKKENGLWILAAKGKVIIPSFIIAEFDSCISSIVFYTVDREYDSNTKKYKFKRKVEEIGKISISDL